MLVSRIGGIKIEEVVFLPEIEERVMRIVMAVVMREKPICKIIKKIV